MDIVAAAVPMDAASAPKAAGRRVKRQTIGSGAPAAAAPLIRGRSRSEDSPNAVETVPLQDGLDALVREAATALGSAAEVQPVSRKRRVHQRTPSLVDASSLLAGLFAQTPPRKETPPPPPPPVAIVTPPRGRYRCARCGQPKANHVCAGAQRFERSVDMQTVGLDPKDVKGATDTVLVVRAWTPARAAAAPSSTRGRDAPPVRKERATPPPPPRAVPRVVKRPRAATMSPPPGLFAGPMAPGLLLPRPRAGSMSPPGLPLLPRPRAGSMPGLPLLAPLPILPWACPCGRSFGFGPRGSPPALAWVAHTRVCPRGLSFPLRPPGR
jgi:hypothetical protein